MSHRQTRSRLALACAALISLAVVATPMASASRADTPGESLGPQELIDSLSKRMFAALDAKRAAIKQDPQQADPLIDTILRPHFDAEYAAQQVLAQHWRSATAEQRRRFIDALYRALRRTYGAAIADFSADRLQLLPFRGDPAALLATVHTRITRSSGTVVNVDYQLRKTADGWKAYNVVVENISYVRNYRADLGAEVSQKGLEAMITRLEHQGLGATEASAQPPSSARH